MSVTEKPVVILRIIREFRVEERHSDIVWRWMWTEMLYDAT